MNEWVKIYLGSKWIILIGVAPLLYALLLKAFFVFLNLIIQIETSKIFQILYEIIFWTGLPVIFFIYYKWQKEQSYIHIKELSQRFMIGLIFTLFGHIGLILFYLTMILPSIFSHLFFIPYMFWMAFFYMIGLSMTSEYINSQIKNKTNTNFSPSNNNL